MKLMIFLATVALAPVNAQFAPMKTAPAATVAAKPDGTVGTPDKSPLATLISFEKDMDGRISTTGGTDPCVIWGASRGIYLSGLGAIFTAEVELANTPGAAAMFQTIGPAQKAKILKNKQAHLPLLEQTLRDMAVSLAASPALKLADSEQVVVSARLWYRPWEDKTGLPGQIVVRIDHRGAMPRMEVQ
jgi:hypothetical protein